MDTIPVHKARVRSWVSSTVVAARNLLPDFNSNCCCGQWNHSGAVFPERWDRAKEFLPFSRRLLQNRREKRLVRNCLTRICLACADSIYSDRSTIPLVSHSMHFVVGARAVSAARWLRRRLLRPPCISGPCPRELPKVRARSFLKAVSRRLKRVHSFERCENTGTISWGLSRSAISD